MRNSRIPYVSKEKTVMEIRINWAYDKTLYKMTGLYLTKGGDAVTLRASQWISKNK